MGFPLGYGSSFRWLGCVTGLSGVNIVHLYVYCKGVGVTRLGESLTLGRFTGGGREWGEAQPQIPRGPRDDTGGGYSVGVLGLCGVVG